MFTMFARFASRRRPANAIAAITLLLRLSTGDARAQLDAFPNLEAVLAAKQDVWGLAAMREPNGPSYEFFEKLLPPLRYVNAEFRHYPIVLSAPNAPTKARLTSNGSGLNARANLNTWKEAGVPVTFYVGDDQHVFGENLANLDGPHYQQGYLPIVRIAYTNEGNVYSQEAFATVEPEVAANAVVLMRFKLEEGSRGKISATFDAPFDLEQTNRVIRSTNGLVIAAFYGWKWNAARKALEVQLGHDGSADLAIATKPLTDEVCARFGPSPAYGLIFPQRRSQCAKVWQKLLDRGTQIEVPEPVVNRAWRALVVSLFKLANQDRMHYSAGNLYDREYEAECGDAVRALLLFGFDQEARRMLTSLLDYRQKGLGFHDAAFKLQLLAHHFWLTRDVDLVGATRAQWRREVDRLLTNRESATGLLPRENYCGDIHTQVYSLNSSANGWRGVRDWAGVLRELGQSVEAAELAGQTAAFRERILVAVAKSERRDVQPPFIPIALFGEEKPYDPLTATMVGGYWCLMSPYVLGSGVFGPGSDRERAILDYLHERGGVCMGMIRFHQHSGLFANEDALDDLYGLRYSIKLLQLDDVDRALVSFYGKLAQGLTRETFLGAEGTGLRPLDAFGRPMYLPPNASAQAYFLWTLRYLLVQDWDLDDDGTPETLRLGFATPKRWLADGKTIKVERAPTAFGPVSFVLESKLRRGEVIAKLDLPARHPPKQTLLRIRVPDGWCVTAAKAGNIELKVDERGAADISSLRGRKTVLFRVNRT
jgi:hypothetical protein